ncbi:TonB-dependent receptor [Sphingomonas koreensis]|uniref:TonB-dependent receptor n=1 Tax=Sphingomonas koreensis TaxID=93064 RepID=A0A430G1Z1_9SPHN|nr:TonB-dependent receptor [Sphingomonas koreensis]RSY82013.1 TonB-dependent receptor [Sphingomonas koreensis]
MLFAASAWAQTAPAASDEAAPQASPTSQQQAEPQQTGIGEIVVTANRRAENLQSVPATVAAITGDSLQSRGIVSASDIGGSLPNLRVNSPFSQTQPNFTIRGIGVANEFNSNAQSPIGVYFDEVYQGFRPSHGAALYDLERIEVLKGPQGTLYGRNTTGGAINLISRRPDLNGANGYITASYGNYNAIMVQGAVEQTLVEDKLGIRLALTRTKRDGFIENVGPENGFPGIAGDEDYQAEDNIAGRATIRFKPNPDLDITLRGYFAYSDPIGSGGVPFLIGPNQTDLIGYSRAGLGRRQVITPGQGKFITKSKGVQGRIDWTLGDIVLTSVSGYDKDEYNLSFDFDGSPTVIGQYRDSRSSFYGLSQDLHLTYDGEGFNIIGGVYAGKQQVRTFQDLVYFGFLNDFAGPNQFNPGGLFFTGPGAPPPTAVSTGAGFTQKQTSYAIYAEAKVDITDKFNITVGGRITRDKVTFEDYYSLLRDSSFNPALYAYTSGRTTPGIGILTGGISPTLEQKATKPTGRVILSYDIADRSLVYASYSRGYRSGSYNGSSPVIQPNGVGPEYVDAYEAGFKSRFWDNRIQLNGSIFYSKYIGQQVQEVANGAAFIRSLSGRLYGAELELTAQPVEDFRLVAAVGYLNTRYDDNQFLAPGDPRATDPRGISLGGNEFPFAPEWTASISPEWTALRTENDGKLVLSGEVQYQSHQWYDFFNAKQAVGPLRNGQKAYTLVNGRVAFETPRFTVAAFIKNAFDVYYNSYGINVESFGADFFVPGPPRTFGGEVSFRF